MSSDERRALYAKLYREELHKLTPSMPGRFSGQQCAYAKGRAGVRLNAELRDEELERRRGGVAWDDRA